MRVTRRFFRGFAQKFGVRGILASLALLLAYFVGDALIHEEAYAELGYAVALISVVGSAAGVGYLLFSNLGCQRRIFGFSSFATNYETGFGEEVTPAPKRFPATVSLLYSAICFLFAGLAGWVDNPV